MNTRHSCDVIRQTFAHFDAATYYAHSVIMGL